MRILVNFMLRDVWHVHCMDEDGRTPIGPLCTVRDRDTLVRLLRYVGAADRDMIAVHHDILRWSRGSIWIELAPARKNLLRIRPPYSDSLERR